MLHLLSKKYQRPLFASFKLSVPFQHYSSLRPGYFPPTITHLKRRIVIEGTCLFDVFYKVTSYKFEYWKGMVEAC
jgi:hypothetical protein